MEYPDMLNFIFEQRKVLDTAVENIVRLNGHGELFRIGKPAVEVKPLGDIFQMVNSDGLFISDKQFE